MTCERKPLSNPLCQSIGLLSASASASCRCGCTDGLRRSVSRPPPSGPHHRRIHNSHSGNAPHTRLIEASLGYFACTICTVYSWNSSAWLPQQLPLKLTLHLPPPPHLRAQSQAKLTAKSLEIITRASTFATYRFDTNHYHHTLSSLWFHCLSIFTSHVTRHLRISQMQPRHAALIHRHALNIYYQQLPVRLVEAEMAESLCQLTSVKALLGPGRPICWMQNIGSIRKYM